MHEALPFVVVGATGPDIAVLDYRFEGRSAPQLQRSYGHHVVMAVYQHGGLFRVDNLLAVDHRVTVGGHHLGFVGTGLEQQLFPALGATHHIGLVLLLGTDGRNTDKAEKFLKETVFVLFNILFHNYNV